ncbi:MAG: hypothetical protein AAFV43_00650 [Planctomycetota bacterium]
MPRFVKILAAAFGVISLIAIVTFLLMRSMATTTPPQYEAAVATTESAAAEELDEQKQNVESQAAAFYSDSQSADVWAIDLPLADVNAWLATRLVEELERRDPNVSVDLYQPRVWTNGDLLMLSAQTVVGPLEGVMTLGVRPTVTERGEIAIEFADTRVGTLPVPPNGVAEHLRRSFVDSLVPIRWAGSETRALAMLDPGRLPFAKDRVWRFTALELTDERLRIACEAETLADESVEQEQPELDLVEETANDADERE